ncbi:unnamed protein product [Boreogadus saida]
MLWLRCPRCLVHAVPGPFIHWRETREWRASGSWDVVPALPGLLSRARSSRAIHSRGTRETRECRGRVAHGSRAINSFAGHGGSRGRRGNAVATVFPPLVGCCCVLLSRSEDIA